MTCMLTPAAPSCAPARWALAPWPPLLKLLERRQARRTPTHCARLWSHFPAKTEKAVHGNPARHRGINDNEESRMGLPANKPDGKMNISRLNAAEEAAHLRRWRDVCDGGGIAGAWRYYCKRIRVVASSIGRYAVQSPCCQYQGSQRFVAEIAAPAPLACIRIRILSSSAAIQSISTTSRMSYLT